MYADLGARPNIGEKAQVDIGQEPALCPSCSRLGGVTGRLDMLVRADLEQFGEDSVDGVEDHVGLGQAAGHLEVRGHAVLVQPRIGDLDRTRFVIDGEQQAGAGILDEDDGVVLNGGAKPDAGLRQAGHLAPEMGTSRFEVARGRAGRRWWHTLVKAVVDRGQECKLGHDGPQPRCQLPAHTPCVLDFRK